MSEVYLYTTRHCHYCVRARQLLDTKGVDYRDIAVDNKPKLRREMMMLSGHSTVPQIWIGDSHVGGCDELYALEHAGRLDQMLAEIIPGSASL